MFDSAQYFNQNIGSWNISSVKTMSNMFTNCGLSIENYSLILIGWSEQISIPSNITLDASISYNLDAISARNKLINEYGWTINDTGLS